MRDYTRTGIGSIGALVLALLFAWPVANYAQEPANSGAALRSSAQNADLAKVLAELRKLRNELSELHVEVDQLRAQQRISELESAELKKELIAAKDQVAAPYANHTVSIPSTPKNSHPVA